MRPVERMPVGSCLLALLVGLAAVLPRGAAQAHPHIWIDARATLVVEDGAIVAIRNEWLFDELFAAYVIDAFDEDRDGAFSADEITKLRYEAFDALEEVNWLTTLGVDGQVVEPVRTLDFAATVEGERLRYTFTLGLAEPVPVGPEPLSVTVFDDSFYIAIDWDPDRAVALEGSDLGCAVDFVRDTTVISLWGVQPVAAVLRCRA
jgi:ABC-type uncharacterized transport system substrate-binding protein